MTAATLVMWMELINLHDGLRYLFLGSHCSGLAELIGKLLAQQSSGYSSITSTPTLNCQIIKDV